MKQKIKQISLGIFIWGFIWALAVAVGIAPQPRFLEAIKPFANTLISADEDYLDAPCTPELCGEDQIDEAAEADIKAEEQAQAQESKAAISATTTPIQEKPVLAVEPTKSEEPQPVQPKQQVQPKPITSTPVVKTPIQPVKDRGLEDARPAADTPAVDDSQKTSQEENTVTLDENSEATSADSLAEKQELQPIIVDEKVVKEVQIQKLEKVQKLVEENKVFSELVGADEMRNISEKLQNLRDNKDSIILAPETPEEQKVFQEQAQQRVEKVKQELIQKGADEKAVQEAVKVERKKIKVEHTHEQVRKKFNAEKVSAEMYFGIDPKKQPKEAGKSSAIDNILFGIADADSIQSEKDKVSIGGPDPYKPQDKNEKVSIGGPDPYSPAPKDNNKTTVGIPQGSRLPHRFTALATAKAGTKNQLILTGADGQDHVVSEAIASDDGRIVFDAQQTIQAGPYALQVRKSGMNAAGRRRGFNPSEYGKASTIALAAGNSTDSSKAVIVEISDEAPFEKPVVKNIQDIEVAGLRDIKVTTDENGKIKVTGSADIDAVVVGTFQSAVFTSAILADVNTGLFEVNSSSALEEGDHEVTIFSTNPSNGSQSEPSRVKFRIVKTSNAAEKDGLQSLVPTSDELEKNPTLLVGISIVVGIVLLVVVGLLLRKKKESRTGISPN